MRVRVYGVFALVVNRRDVRRPAAGDQFTKVANELSTARRVELAWQCDDQLVDDARVHAIGVLRVAKPRLNRRSILRDALRQPGDQCAHRVLAHDVASVRGSGARCMRAPTYRAV